MTNAERVIGACPCGPADRPGRVTGCRTGRRL